MKGYHKWTNEKTTIFQPPIPSVDCLSTIALPNSFSPSRVSKLGPLHCRQILYHLSYREVSSGNILILKNYLSEIQVYSNLPSPSSDTLQNWPSPSTLRVTQLPLHPTPSSISSPTLRGSHTDRRQCFLFT